MALVRRFIVDSSLGGLAKWLRFWGYDTECRPFGRQAGPGGLPVEAGCLWLTRRRELQKLNRSDILVIKATTVEEQLEEVSRHLGLAQQSSWPLSRCGRCNEVLTPVPRAQAEGRVPDHILLSHAEFLECPRCHRLYWPGSHRHNIMRKLRLGALSGSD